MKSQCISVPVSWLALEQHALGESAQAQMIEQHLAKCGACQATMVSIRHDERRMPALHVPALPPARCAWSWRWALALAPALAILVFVMNRPREDAGHDYGAKGGDASMLLIRERDGQLLEPTHFTEGDRFKVQLSCAPGLREVLVAVTQDGETLHPLPAGPVHCGNQVMLPGAFSLAGGAAEVCVRIENRAGALCARLLPED